PEVSLETERRVPMSQTAHGARAVLGLVYAYQVAARCSVARVGCLTGRPSASRAVLEADGCACAQSGTMTPARDRAGDCRRAACWSMASSRTRWSWGRSNIMGRVGAR